MNNNFFYKKALSNIYKKPTQMSEVTSQILYGEKFKILSKNKNWIKIKISFDNYVGFIKNKDYTNDHKPTHKIFTLKANIFNKQKQKTRYFLPFASKILIIQENKKFVEYEKNKWIKKKNIKKIDHIEKNYLKVLKLFLKTKYVWGGKTYRGIDCSAILQLLYYYNNKFYPRDTRDQIKYSTKNQKKIIFKRGDIIFWKGHVAICINSKKLIHAYGPEKKVLIMPITKTIDKIERTAKLIVKKISSIKY
ncbi:NlpC/P60 family protein [Candidatus Pelagibacter sp. Uisw_099_02]|uniref:C40 family peptidase n=1 Tax=Candidatus Pelagibacter sp. Uisw_099_02 TaxID=3230981 RepID=UPI0039E8231A